MSGKKFDSLDFIMRYEGGKCSEEEVVEGFQHLLDEGLVWQLQGSYGRTASSLIAAGLIHPPVDKEKGDA